MKEYKVKYSQLLFLYAYLRQIDLSLDRSRWTQWDKLQGYFQNRLQPCQVIEYLKKTFQLPDTNLDKFVFFIEKKTLTEKLRSTINKNFYLKQNELIYYCKLLLYFDKYLKSDFLEYTLEIEKLRIDIAKSYSKSLEYMISKKDLTRLMKIEHFEQSNKIAVISLDEFIPDDF